MCFECDSVWDGLETVCDQTGTTFEEHMQSIGRQPDWNEVERLEMVT
jgi:hypothetical protein